MFEYLDVIMRREEKEGVGGERSREKPGWVGGRGEERRSKTDR